MDSCPVAVQQSGTGEHKRSGFNTAEPHAISARTGSQALNQWRAELLTNYKNDTRTEKRLLVTELDNGALASSPEVSDSDRVQLTGYLLSMDRLTRRVFIAHA